MTLSWARYLRGLLAGGGAQVFWGFWEDLDPPEKGRQPGGLAGFCWSCGNSLRRQPRNTEAIGATTTEGPRCSPSVPGGKERPQGGSP